MTQTFHIALYKVAFAKKMKKLEKELANSFSAARSKVLSAQLMALNGSAAQALREAAFYRIVHKNGKKWQAAGGKWTSDVNKAYDNFTFADTKTFELPKGGKWEMIVPIENK